MKQISINTNMWTGAVYKRRWLENADLIFIGCSYFSCICTTVQTADPDVIVHSSRNYLNSFKIIGQNHNIATSCVRLDGIYRSQSIKYFSTLCSQIVFKPYHINLSYLDSISFNMIYYHFNIFDKVFKQLIAKH